MSRGFFSSRLKQTLRECKVLNQISAVGAGNVAAAASPRKFFRANLSELWAKVPTI